MDKRQPKTTPMLSGEQLISEFMGAMTNLTTAVTAVHTAGQSEANTIQTIKAAASGVYADPDNFPLTSQEALVRSSLNAHIQKVQAEQLSSMARNQITQVEAELNQSYRGKKAVVTVLDQTNQPVESYWLDSHTGKENIHQVNASKIKGIIQEISLFKNALVLKPTASSRMILPARKFFFVYIVNPKTLTPMVTISLF